MTSADNKRRAEEIVSIWGFPSSDWKSGHPGLVASIAAALDDAYARGAASTSLAPVAEERCAWTLGKLEPCGLPKSDLRHNMDHTKSDLCGYAFACHAFQSPEQRKEST